MEFFNERILIKVRDCIGARLAAGVSDAARPVLIASHGDGAPRFACWNSEQTVRN
jgi:hypothetical protein